MKEVTVRCASGVTRKVVAVKEDGGTIFVCSAERYASTSQDALGAYLVGFPKSDVLELSNVRS